MDSKNGLTLKIEASFGIANMNAHFTITRNLTQTTKGVRATRANIMVTNTEVVIMPKMHSRLRVNEGLVYVLDGGVIHVLCSYGVPVGDGGVRGTARGGDGCRSTGLSWLGDRNVDGLFVNGDGGRGVVLARFQLGGRATSLVGGGRCLRTKSCAGRKP
jgi:hypothetical protein